MHDPKREPSWSLPKKAMKENAMNMTMIMSRQGVEFAIERMEYRPPSGVST
jgi:hypothetical protein